LGKREREMGEAVQEEGKSREWERERGAGGWKEGGREGASERVGCGDRRGNSDECCFLKSHARVGWPVQCLMPMLNERCWGRVAMLSETWWVGLVGLAEGAPLYTGTHRGRVARSAFGAYA
jgi:hypothetical protein